MSYKKYYIKNKTQLKKSGLKVENPVFPFALVTNGKKYALNTLSKKMTKEQIDRWLDGAEQYLINQYGI